MILLVLQTTTVALGLTHPLSSEQVRQAYFLGRSTDDEKLVRFIEPYLHRLPYPQKGPYIESVEFRTPYEQIVLKTRQNLSNYSAQDAREEYLKHPASVIVRIMIFLTSTYHGPAVRSPDGTPRHWTDEDFLNDFKFRVAQQQPIQPMKVSAGPACPYPNQCEPFDGFEILLEFRAEQFSNEPVTIHIQTPDGQSIKTAFDLGNLT